MYQKDQIYSNQGHTSIKCTIKTSNSCFNTHALIQTTPKDVVEVEYKMYFVYNWIPIKLQPTSCRLIFSNRTLKLFYIQNLLHALVTLYCSQNKD